jgi:hypothetical protein
LADQGPGIKSQVARYRGRAEEPADEPPTKERLKLHDGSILLAGGDNQTGVAVRDAHALRFRHGSKGPY